MGFEVIGEKVDFNFMCCKDKGEGVEYPYHNVKDFGAVGDGKSSDAAAIQAALDQAKLSANGAVVIIPDGTYLISEHLSIYSNTVLRVNPNARIIRDHEGYLIMNGDRDKSYYGYEGEDNIEISGGVWDQNAAEYGQAIAFSIGHGKYISIRDLTIKNVPGSHAIEINSSRNVTVSNCKFLGFKDPGGREFSEAIQIDLAREEGVFPPFGAYDYTPCEKITITKCYFGKSETEGPWGRAIGSHSATIGRWHEDIIITDNMMEDISLQAIRSYSWKRVVVANNSFINCGGAVGIYPPLLSKPQDTKDDQGNQTNQSQPCEQYVISNNSIWGGLSYSPGISISGQDGNGTIMDVTVTGNIISHAAGNSGGIYMNNAEKVNVTGNNISAINSYGISGSNGQLFTVESNILRDIKSEGIVMKDAVEQVTIAGNQLKNIDHSGINVTDKVSMVVVSNNNILNANRKHVLDAQHIRITNNVARVSLTNNVCYQDPDEEATEGLRITRTVTKLVRTGNNFADLPLLDTSNSLVGVDLEG